MLGLLTIQLKVFDAQSFESMWQQDISKKGWAFYILKIGVQSIAGKLGKVLAPLENMSENNLMVYFRDKCFEKLLYFSSVFPHISSVLRQISAAAVL